MLRRSVAITIACLGLALPALAHSPARTSTDSKPTSAVADALGCGDYTHHESPEWDSNARWRMRAARHLDCVALAIDRALDEKPAAAQSGREFSGEVRISRADLERIRTWAFWAKDAAMRIGR